MVISTFIAVLLRDFGGGIGSRIGGGLGVICGDLVAICGDLGVN